jgi:hypothetical protein
METIEDLDVAISKLHHSLEIIEILIPTSDTPLFLASHSEHLLELLHKLEKRKYKLVKELNNEI